MTRDIKLAYFKVHFAVLLFGFTGILGSLIHLNAEVLVMWRALISAAFILIILQWDKSYHPWQWSKAIRFLGIGIIVALHWWCFYGSIKLANSSVAMICLATIPFFTALFDSLISKQKLHRLDLYFAVLVLPGVFFIVNDLNQIFFWGFVVGILASVFSGLFSALNKKFIHEARPMEITFYELCTVFIVMGTVSLIQACFSPKSNFIPSTLDWGYLLILSIVCTVIAYVLSLSAMKHLSAFTTMFAYNMEPVYGILISVLILQEHKNLEKSFFIGTFWILSVVFIHSFIAFRKTGS